MKPALTLVLFLAAFGQPAGAANPGDLEFRLVLTRDVPSYHMGEPIEFELSYTSESDRQYLISPSSLAPDFGSATVHLTPLEGTLDPRVLRPCWGGIGGSFLSSGPQYLGRQPIKVQADLTGWYRFRKPGHYAFSVTSREVRRLRSVDDGGGAEVLNLESNTMEFDILPRDPVWEADQVRAILLRLADATYPGDRTVAANRLALLDTPDSVRKLVELYLASPSSEKSIYSLGLSQSSQLDVVIPLLEAALNNPEVSLPGLPELLAELQIRKQRGVLAASTGDPAAQQQRESECQERRKLYDDHLRRYQALLLSRAANDSGSPRGAALYEAWNLAENQRPLGHPPGENLTELRLAVLNVAEKLEADQQTQFLISEWQVLPHADLKPLILALASTHRFEAYQFWCEDWPGECSAAIVSDALKPGTQLAPFQILMIPETGHPEMDSALREQLADPNMVLPHMPSQRVAALVLRVGSGDLRPDVDKVLSELAAKRGYNCDVEGYLLGYLFKVALEDGQKRLAERLQDDKCGDQFLRILNNARYSDALIPAATKALRSENLSAAGTAALFLAEHAPAATEDVLWERLNAFWLVWQDRAGELRAAYPGTDRGSASQNARLEQSLASALAYAKNWKLTPSEQVRLRNGCITEPCRDIADGKMRLGL